MSRIVITEFCRGSHVTRADGAHLRREIERRWDDSEPLTLDFADVRIASVSFLDESLGVLAKGRGLQELTRRVRVENMDPADRSLLNNIAIARDRERGAADAESQPRPQRQSP
jgi:hypothetical protein